MFNQLVESKNSVSEKKRLTKFLITVALTVTCILSFGVVYSLFAYNLGIGNENLEFSNLVSPINLPEKAPSPEKEITAEKQGTVSKTISELPSRRENIQRLDETPVETPEKVSTVPNQNKARPNSPYTISKIETDGVSANPNKIEREGNGENTGSVVRRIVEKEKDEEGEKGNAPVLPSLPKKENKQPEKLADKPKAPQSLGVVNGKASSLVKPIYSPAAKLLGLNGTVKIQVLIDENGNVISANAISGHPILSDAAQKAAKASKFTPTYLSGEKVKVTGFIIYNFVKQ